MKKKKVLYAVLASAFLTTLLTSCGNEEIITTSTGVYNLEENSISQKVFYEFVKTNPDATYDDFFDNARIERVNDDITYYYNGSYILLNSVGRFKEKYIVTKENNVKCEELYRYIDYKWIKISEYEIINGGTKKVYEAKTLNKHSYTYDDNGNLLTDTISVCYSNEWVVQEKREYTYDNDGNLLTKIDFEYINTTEIWRPKTKEEYTYDESSHLLKKVLYTFIDDWIYFGKYEYTYNTKGKELSKTYSAYKNNSWVYDWKHEFTYDSNDNLLCIQEFYYLNNSWVYDNKEEYTYNTMGILLNILYSVYDNNSWKNSSKLEYTYDSKWNRLTELNSLYKDNTWVSDYKYEYTYNSNGNRLTTLESRYIDDAWVDICKYEHTYDSYGNILSDKYVYYNYGYVIVNTTDYSYSENAKLIAETEYEYAEYL